MPRTISVSLILVLCLLFCTLAGRSLSQTQSSASPEESQQRHEQRLKNIERQAEFQRRIEEQRFQTEQRLRMASKVRQEYSDEAWQEALGATAEQWRLIKPRLEKVRDAEAPPVLRFTTYTFKETSGTAPSSSNRGSGETGGAGPGRGIVSGGPGGLGYSKSGDSRTRFRAPPGPIMKKVDDLGLGWQWSRPSVKKSPDQLSENERTCEQLLDAVETKNPDPEQIRQRIEALRHIREQEQARQQAARAELRRVVTPEQETRLVVMGYLD